MKAAILISGHMRTFAECLPNIRWMLLRHFPDADFFVSTIEDEDASSFKLLSNHPELVPAHVIHARQPEFVLPKQCPAKWQGTNRPFMHEPYAISVSPQAVIGQLWQLQNVWELYSANPVFATHDIVIRLRPDLWFHEFELPIEIARSSKLAPGLKPAFFPNMIFSPWWGRFGGVNDRLGIMGREAALHYFTTFSKISRLVAAGCPLHPESLVRASLEEGDAMFCQLDAVFSTRRKAGEMRPPEILASDIATRAGG